MLSLAGYRNSVGLLVGLAVLSVTTGDARAQYYQSSCRSGYSSVRYQPRYRATVVYVNRPVVVVKRIRPQRYVYYRSYSRPHHYYRRDTGLGHLVHHLFHSGHGHHGFRHRHHGFRHGHGIRRGHGHHGRYARHFRH